MVFDVNWVAVIVATVGGFAVGAAWYMGLAKQWQAAIGKTRDQLDAGPVPYIIGVAVELVMAVILAVVIRSIFGEVTVANGLLTGAVMWLGFVMPPMILNHRYQNMPWQLTIIDGGHLLAVLLVQGLVIGLFGGGVPVPVA
jgi:uncharacterized membrane protein YagU involved in acid resistance